MKRHKKLCVVITLLSITVLWFAVNNIKIFLINPHEAEHVYELFQSQYNTESNDICILDYDYVTGTGWRVEKSTNKDLENQYVCLNTICNPRDLKINEEFELDNRAKYVVVTDKSFSQTEIDGETVKVLKTKEIVITNFYYYNDEVDDISFGDLTLAGRFKSILAFIVPKFKLQT